MFANRRITPVLLVFLPLLTFLFAGCVGLTPQFSHQGRLLDSSGNPVPDGNYDVDYKIYQNSSGGTAVYTETQTIAVEDGLFTTSIGATSIISPEIFAQPTWMELTINGETLSPRQRLEGAPFAFSLVSGAVVQGSQDIGRDFATLTDTGAAMTVWNQADDQTGGHGLLAINQAAPLGDDRQKVAALQAIAGGGSATGPFADQTGAYGAIIRSLAYRGLYAEGATTDDARYYAAVFESGSGILLSGGGFCTGCTTAFVARNDGAAPIQPGDFVAVSGVQVDEELNMPVMLVYRAASSSDAIVGVATGAMTRTPAGDYYGMSTGGYEAKGGTAVTNEYVSVAVQGLVQANVGPGAAWQIGEFLTMGEGSVTSAVVSPSASPGQPTIGRLMSAVDGSGQAWIMLGGQ